jgi:hypothetical protein
MDFIRICRYLVAVHYDRNRTQRRESSLGVQTARAISDEEKRTFISKQLNFYENKRQT